MATVRQVFLNQGRSAPVARWRYAGGVARGCVSIVLQGCWNWWGYAGDKQFLTKRGVQVGAIWSMVQRVTGQGN